MSKNFDIFISYRRKETADKAEHLFRLLEMAGYKGQVSFDRENFDGRFDLEILQRLDDCKDFIVALAPETLAELNEEDTHWYEKLARCTVSEFPGIETKMKASGAILDFVRLEIARAIAKGKHIIPVVPVNTPEYNFDRLVLPDDIALLQKEHAEHYQDTKDFLFKDILPKITKRLKSKPNKNRWLKWAIVLALLLAIVAGIATWVKWSNERDQFDNCRTQSDYEQLSANSLFFAGQCQDSLQMFASLKSPYAQINDSKNTDRNDSLKVKWNEDCSLQQLRVLRNLINNMMRIEKGIFVMGTPEPLGLEDTPHEVMIETDYYIGKFEVSEQEWNVVMKDSMIGDSKIPMTYVSWNDCQQFVRKLQSLTGLVFTLPTEAEWEYAARKNCENCKYAGSDNPEDVASYATNTEDKPMTISIHEPNAMELYDMSGNVSEWCENGVESKKIIRGGSFMSSKEEITVTYADAASIETRSKEIGLRLVLKP
ncbi:MAG: SUMF1/EgtB/PvdO family nonheme iron enzyme [Bacteroidaceae bacterium]|nr:SUMF1/EgtB/PvdO family nonheme iron enzyme [Bacteroidaceae bacterium]